MQAAPPALRARAAKPTADAVGFFLPAPRNPARPALKRELVENASTEHIEGRAVLVAEVSPETLDTLAAFEADLADREIDVEDEPDEGQEQDGADLEEDDPPEDNGDGEDADSDECAATYELTR